MKRCVGRGIVSVLILAALLVGMVPAMAAETGTDLPAPDWTQGLLEPGEKVKVLVELEAAPAVEASTYGTRGAELYKAELMAAQAEVFESAQAEMDVEVGYQYSSIFNGFSCEVAYADAAALSQMEGVKAVYPVEYYSAPKTVETQPVNMLPLMATSGGANGTGNIQMATEGHGGQGIVVAVLDTGFNLSHPAFGVYEDVLGTVALTQEAVEAKIAADATTGTAGRGKYVSAKVPFACNYKNETDSTALTYANRHGTHVAGIVGGYEKSGEDVVFSGAAPGAQLLLMQVFADQGGTSTDVYLKALEDAINLGADVVNMSFGVPNGFSNTGDTPSLEEQVYQRMAEAGILVCVGAGNNGSYFNNQDSRYTDYATLGSPSTYAGNISVASVDNLGSGTSTDGNYRFSKSFSSLGPANNLEIRPTLTSVGGAVVSANAANPNGATFEDRYYAEWGTSMSSPHLAGTFANLLDYLRGKGIADKAVAGQLARVLMESSAVPVLGENSTATDAQPNTRFATVMQQGAGLGNSAKAMAAYEHGAYLEDPLQELGDDPGKTGRYAMTLTLKNATAADVTYTPGAVVMTDEVVDGVNTQRSAYLYNSKGGTSFETEMATFTAPASVTVPANGSVDVEVTVTLTDAGKTYMNETFPCGGYIDGFVTFTPAEGSQAPEVHATYLAYYGDWAASPAIGEFSPLCGKETAPFADFSHVKLGFCNIKVSGRPWNDDYLPLGENPMNGWNATENDLGDTAPYNAKHAAFPGGYKTDQTTDGISNILYNALVVEPVPLRNLESISFTVSSGTDDAMVYRTGSLQNRMTKSTYNETSKEWGTGGRFTWDAYTDNSVDDAVSSTRWLASDKVVKVTLRATVPYDRDGDGAEESHECGQFTLVVDHTDPTLDVANAAYDQTGGTLTIQATDNQYVAAVYLVDDQGNTLDCDLFSEDAPNTAVTATLNVSGRAAGDAVKVRVMDYATNWVEQTVTLTVPEEPDTVMVTFDVNGGAEPESHGDYTQTVVVGSAPAVPAVNPTRTDYTFLGWAAERDGTVLETLPVTTADTNVTYYAKWEAVTPTVAVALAYDETAKTITATPTVNLTQYNVAYAWTENGAAAPGATDGNTYTVPQNAQPGDHVYTCTATVTHPGDSTKTATSEPVTQTVTIPQSVTPTPGGGGTGGGGTGGGGGGTGGGGVGGGGSTGSGGTVPPAADTTETRESPDGGTVTLVTTPAGDKTFTVANADGEQLAHVAIPAQIEALPESQRFADVPVGHWSDATIHRMASLGLFKGVDAQHQIFDMNAPMTRGSLAEVLYRLSEGKQGIESSFSDVEPDAWYTDSVAWAAKCGVVNGIGDDTFQPKRVITRQELATMLYRYAQFLGVASAAKTEDLNAFSDGADTAAWAAPGVAWCVREGILQGKGNGVLDPTAQITRAEAAAMLDRLLGALK